MDFKTKRANPENPGVQDIDPKELWENRSEVAIIDVRRPDEFTGELGHVPGASHIVLDSLPARIDEIPRDRTVVFVCRSGGRSGRATAFALSSGLKDVFNMKGGMLLWNELGLQTEGRSE